MSNFYFARCVSHENFSKEICLGFVCFPITECSLTPNEPEFHSCCGHRREVPANLGFAFRPHVFQIEVRKSVSDCSAETLMLRETVLRFRGKVFDKLDIALECLSEWPAKRVR